MNLNKNISIWRGDSTPPTNYHFWIKSNGLLFTFNGEKWVNYVEDIPTASLESKGLMSSLDKAALDELPNSISEAEISSISNTLTANDVTIETLSTNQRLTTTIPCATLTTAGVMSAEDKVALDNAKLLVNITYDKLKSLRDSSKLIPGMLYRITDYEFTTLNPLLKAKPSTFDIIVTADDDHTLNEDARAVGKDIQEPVVPQVTKLNVIDIAGEYAGTVDDVDYYEYEDVMEIDGVVYYKWRKYESDVTDFFILTDTRIFEGVTAESPYTPIGYGWTDADGGYPEGGSHSDKAVFPADADVVGPRNYAAWELKYTIDNVLWSVSKGQWIWTDDEMEFERVGTIEIDGKTCVLWYNKDFDPGFEEGETKGYYASYGEVESNDTMLALVDIENKRIVSEDYGHVFYVYKGDAEGKGTILWLKDEYCNSAYYDHYNALVRDDQDTKWFPTFAAECYDNIIGPYNDEHESRFEQIGVNIFYKGCYCNRLDANNKWNTFGNDCYLNRFGYGCTYNKLGNNCNSNTFGHGCSFNTFNYGCTYNKLGNNCNSNTFGHGCTSYTFDNDCTYNTFGDNCHSNTFNDNCGYNKFGDSCSYNKFGNYCSSNKFSNVCARNTFGHNCCNNTFGEKCLDNMFDSSCSGNTFDNNCARNMFGPNGSYNKLGLNCVGNKIGPNCFENKCGSVWCSNTLGSSCQNNTFGDRCKDNTFDNTCRNNTFGSTCSSNTFGSICSYNKFGSYCLGNTFGSSCQRLSIEDQVSFAYVLQSTNYDSNTTNITIDFLPNKTYCQYAGYNSSGELKIWVPADLVLV